MHAVRRLTTTAATSTLLKTPRAIPTESILKAGTPITGLNILKGGKDPVAMENDQYPAWLWELEARNTPNERTPESELSLDHLREESKKKIKSNALSKKSK